MSDPNPLNEQAIRDAVDADLNARMPKAGPQGGPRRRRERERERDTEAAHLMKGTITGVNGQDVFVELGPKTQGVIALAEFETPPNVGDTDEFSLISIKDGLWTLSRKEARTLATWRELERGREVKAKVIGENSGGLELKIGPVTAFMPASEISTERVTDFLPYIGQTLTCEVLEVAPHRKRVVLSRKSVMFRERRAVREETLKTLSVGMVVRGKVEKIEPFGAFVAIADGLSGLLHVSNISHQRTADPSKVLTVGQEVEVQVLEIKEGGKRIGLGMKQLTVDPWSAALGRFRSEAVVKGKVVRIAEFGAFVELEPGLEGLCHKSQLSPERVRVVEDAVKVGDDVTVRVVSVDPKAKKIALSRLSSRGVLIGSEEDVSNEEVNQHMDRGKSSGTNLGALLREAMAKKGISPR